MGVFTNKRHFLRKNLTFIESLGIEGKNGGFNRFLFDLGISNNGEHWKVDHSIIDWNRLENHYQFFFDFENNELKISNWLKNSQLAKYKFLYTWLDWNDPIIKIKTSDFIQNWNEFYIASIEGMVLTTTDGKKYMEFTDDWKYNLNSNFEIKTNTKK